MTDPIDNHFKAELNRLQIPGRWAWWPAEQGQELRPLPASFLGHFLDAHPALKEHIDWDPEIAQKHQQKQPKFLYDPSNRLDFHHVAPDGKQIVGAIPYRAEAITECLGVLKGTKFWDKPAPENFPPPILAERPTDRPAPDEDRGVYLLIQLPHPIKANS